MFVLWGPYQETLEEDNVSKNVAEVILDQIELNRMWINYYLLFVHFYCDVSSWAGYMQPINFFFVLTDCRQLQEKNMVE